MQVLSFTDFTYFFLNSVGCYNISKIMIFLGGFVTDTDKWNRMTLMYPRCRRDDKKDAFNTELQLRAVERPGWSPLNDTGFLVKIDKKMFAYSVKGERIRDVRNLVGHMVRIEAEIMNFVGDRTGWFIRCHSVQCLD